MISQSPWLKPDAFHLPKEDDGEDLLSIFTASPLKDSLEALQVIQMQAVPHKCSTIYEENKEASHCVKFTSNKHGNNKEIPHQSKLLCSICSHFINKQILFIQSFAGSLVFFTLRTTNIYSSHFLQPVSCLVSHILIYLFY